MKRVFFIAFAIFIHSMSWAGGLSPIGKWKTIDDNTKEPRAIVEVYSDGDSLKGKIIKTFPKPGDKEFCEKCKGDLKDKPIVGLGIIWGLKDRGSDWGDGEILDPENGKIYSAKIEVIEDGKKLKVRGFLGFSLLGRTQVWEKDSEN